MISQIDPLEIERSGFYMPTVMIIPSGIGCSIGGFAGDAIPTARLLAAASGCLITHPNVLNGASLYWNDPRIHYVEGYALDKFAKGDIALKLVKGQKIGLLLDAGLNPVLRKRHLQVVDACRASLGLNIGPVVTTEVPLQITIKTGPSGSSWGELLNPDELLRAGEKLKNAGVNAVAVVTSFTDLESNEELNSYRQGEGVDVLAGAEAIISHLLVRHLSLPCAHAPALAELPLEFDLDPRIAGEEIGHTFLPCVLVGLSRAPQFIQNFHSNFPPTNNSSGLIYSDQIGAIVIPEGALGGEAVLASLEKKVPLIIVKNRNVLNVSLEKFIGAASTQNKNNLLIFKAENYLEAAGLVTLLREGISLESIKRPINPITELDN